MIIYPAIDLMDGKCVRLVQGERDRRTVYSDNPADTACRWRDAGAKWLHVVDLDATLDQRCFANLESVKSIVAKSGLKVELGGGIRTAEHIRTYLGEGVERVITGTAALQSEQFASEIFAEFGARVALGLDSRDGKAAIKGWTSLTDIGTEDAALKMQQLGAKIMIVTDIRRDGMLSEPNFEMLDRLCEILDAEIIASGGVSDIEHVRRLHELGRPNMNGAIVGKALYEGRFDLAKAIELFQE